MKCAWCMAPLIDRYGEPRWEVFTGVLPGQPGRYNRAKRPNAEHIFVCYESCPHTAPSTVDDLRVLLGADHS